MLLGDASPLLDCPFCKPKHTRQSCFASGCPDNCLKAVFKMLHTATVKLCYTNWQDRNFTDTGKALLHHGCMQAHIYSMTDHKKAVGARLRKIIDLLGMQYTDAAEIMGISKQVLRNWMNGDSYPSPYNLYKLCRAKGVDFDYVFLGNWDHLPHHLAKVLDQELANQLEPGQVAPSGAARMDDAEA